MQTLVQSTWLIWGRWCHTCWTKALNQRRKRSVTFLSCAFPVLAFSSEKSQWFWGCGQIKPKISIRCLRSSCPLWFSIFKKLFYGNQGTRATSVYHPQKSEDVKAEHGLLGRSAGGSYTEVTILLRGSQVRLLAFDPLLHVVVLLSVHCQTQK